MNGVSEHWWPTDWCERQEVTAFCCFFHSCCPLPLSCFGSLRFLLPLCFESKQEASFHLVTRVMNFVDYKLEKLSLINFDRSLISDTLQTELCVNQRARYLEALPVCKVTKDLFPEAFAGICTVLKKTVCENEEDWNSEFQHLSGWRDGRSADVHNIAVIAVVFFMYSTYSVQKKPQETHLVRCQKDPERVKLVVWEVLSEMTCLTSSPPLMQWPQPFAWLSFICVSKDVYVAGGLASCLYITATGAAEMVWMIPNPAGICQGTKRPTNQRTSSYLPTLSMQNHKEKVLDRLVTSDSGQRLWCSEPCNRNKREREGEWQTF